MFRFKNLTSRTLWCLMKKNLSVAKSLLSTNQYKNAIELLLEDFSSCSSWYSCYLIGKCFIKLANHSEAKRYLDLGLSLDKRNPAILTGLAELMDVDDEYDSIIELLDNLAVEKNSIFETLNTESADGFLNMFSDREILELYNQAGEDYFAAVGRKVYMEACELYPSRTNDPEDASPEFFMYCLGETKERLAQKITYAYIQNVMAECHMRLNEFKRAKTLFDYAIEMSLEDSEFDLPRKNLNKITNL